jgi:signal peptidase I
MKRRVWAASCLLALLLVYLVCPFRLGIVCGASMEPTYHNGQAILVDRSYYRRHPVARGDVILLRQDGRTLIKRVFALAGDSFHVLVCPDEAGVNRYIVDDQDVPRLRRVFRFAAAGRHVARIMIPSGGLYVLGDNTSASIDSRDFGTVPLTDVIGRVNEQRPGALVAQVTTGGAPTPILALQKTRPTSSGGLTHLVQTAASTAVERGGVGARPRVLSGSR